MGQKVSLVCLISLNSISMVTFGGALLVAHRALTAPAQPQQVTGRFMLYLMTIWMDLSKIKHTRLTYRTILTPHMQGLTNFDHGVGLWWCCFWGLSLY